MITLRLSLHSNPRGPGFWKLNTSFLTELEYINQIKTTIQETYEEYKNDESVSPSLLWEMIKLKVCEKSLRYSKNKTKQAKQREIYFGTNNCQTTRGTGQQNYRRHALFTPGGAIER